MTLSNYIMQALQEQIIGQEYAITALTRAATLALAGLRNRYRPLAVLLFVGPTGSGKTYITQSLARVLLGDERRIIYVNCHLLGQIPDPSKSLQEQLLAAYWRFQTTVPLPRSGSFIILFEEIDKAPPAFRDDLAIAIDRGEILTPGCLFPLHNSFVILTGTFAKKKTDQLIGRGIGFSPDEEMGKEPPERHLAALEELDRMLGPRLVSRIDEVIIFEQFDEQDIVTALERQLTEIERYLAAFSIGFLIDEGARTFLLKYGLEDLTHGMRQIKRVVRNHLLFPIADLMLSGRLVPGTTVVVKHEAPRSFLNFEIMIPQLAPAPPT